MVEFDSTPISIGCTIKIYVVSVDMRSEISSFINNEMDEAFGHIEVDTGPAFPGDKKSFVVHTRNNRINVHTLIELDNAFSRIAKEGEFLQIRSEPLDKTAGEKQVVSQIYFWFKTEGEHNKEVVRRVLVPRLGPTSIDPIPTGEDGTFMTNEFEIDSDWNMSRVEKAAEFGKIIREEVDAVSMAIRCEAI